MLMNVERNKTTVIRYAVVILMDGTTAPVEKATLLTMMDILVMVGHLRERKRACVCVCVRKQLSIFKKMCLINFVLYHIFTDIDECAESNGSVLCESELTGYQCINTGGSYECLCRDGYQFNEDQNMCAGKTLLSYNHHSFISLSHTHTLSLSRSLSIDIDECAINGSSLCQRDCTNTEGSYQCSCGEWYVFESPYNCTGQFYLLFLARKINNFEHL